MDGLLVLLLQSNNWLGKGTEGFARTMRPLLLSYSDLVQDK